MEILVSGKFSADVSAGALAIANKLRGLVEATNIRDVDAALDSLVFFPVILSDDLGIDLNEHIQFVIGAMTGIARELGLDSDASVKVPSE